jgi:mRNA interferase HigB
MAWCAASCAPRNVKVDNSPKCHCSHNGNVLVSAMRVIGKSSLPKFWERSPDARASLERWHDLAKKADAWKTTDDVQNSFSNAKVLSGERVRFEIAGNSYRLIVAFNFRAQIAFVKFIGTHPEYDKVDALTVSQF